MIPCPKHFQPPFDKQVGTPTKARAGFKKGYPNYGRPQWAFEKARLARPGRQAQASKAKIDQIGTVGQMGQKIQKRLKT